MRPYPECDNSPISHSCDAQIVINYLLYAAESDGIIEMFSRGEIVRSKYVPCSIRTMTTVFSEKTVSVIIIHKCQAVTCMKYEKMHISDGVRGVCILLLSKITYFLMRYHLVEKAPPFGAVLLCVPAGVGKSEIIDMFDLIIIS